MSWAAATRRGSRDPPLIIGRVSEPLVLVRWRDAFFDFETGDRGWPDDFIVQTVGYLVRDDDTWLSLAQEALASGDWRAVTHIPRAIVQSVTYLQERTEAKRISDTVMKVLP